MQARPPQPPRGPSGVSMAGRKPLTAEQEARAEAVRTAGQALRKQLGPFTSQPGAEQDIHRLAEWILTGERGE